MSSATLQKNPHKIEYNFKKLKLCLKYNFSKSCSDKLKGISKLHIAIIAYVYIDRSQKLIVMQKI